MTDPLEEATKVRPRDWPAKWVREETFWREMTTRTLSALLASGIVFFAARSAGLFSQIPWKTVGIWAGIVAVVPVSIYLLSVVIGEWFGDRRYRREGREAMRLWHLDGARPVNMTPEQREKFEPYMREGYGRRWNRDKRRLSPEKYEYYLTTMINGTGEDTKERARVVLSEFGIENYI
jgi:hypothetical protein